MKNLKDEYKKYSKLDNMFAAIGITHGMVVAIVAISYLPKTTQITPTIWTFLVIAVFIFLVLIGLSTYYARKSLNLFDECIERAISEIKELIKENVDSSNFVVLKKSERKYVVAFHNVTVDYYTLQGMVNEKVSEINNVIEANLSVELL